MAKTAARRKRDRIRQRAAADEARLVYGPQLSQLGGMIGELQREAKGEIKATRAGARQLHESVSANVPKTQALYDTARSRSEQFGKDMAPDLAALSPTAQARLRSEAGYLGQSRETSGARDTAEVARRASDALVHGQQQIRGIRQGFKSERSRLQGQMLETMGQAGLFQGKRIREMTDEDRNRSIQMLQVRDQLANSRSTRADRRADNRRANREARIERQNVAKGLKPDGTPLPASKLPGGNKPKDGPTAEMRTNASKDYEYALSVAKAGVAGKKPRNKIAAALVRGHSEANVKQTDPLYASIALDIAYDGHVSARNRERMRARGIKFRDLGISGTQTRARKPKATPASGSPSMPAYRY